MDTALEENDNVVLVRLFEVELYVVNWCAHTVFQIVLRRLLRHILIFECPCVTMFKEEAKPIFFMNDNTLLYSAEKANE